MIRCGAQLRPNLLPQVGTTGSTKAIQPDNGELVSPISQAIRLAEP
jgi:hypothetical protein